jgi:hypothetical protein
MERPVRSASTLATAVFVPVALLIVAALLWSLSDEVVVLGILDPAAFGWLVLVPLLASVPIVGGIALSRADRRTHWPVAVALGTLTGLAVAGLFLRSVASVDCEFGLIRAPIAWLPNAAGFGLASGVPLAAGLASVAALWRERRVAAVFAGLAASAAAFFLLAFVLGLSFQPLCNRPF